MFVSHILLGCLLVVWVEAFGPWNLLNRYLPYSDPASGPRGGYRDPPPRPRGGYRDPAPGPRGGYRDSYRPTTCSRETPCYDITLNYILDGVIDYDMSPGILQRMYNRFRVNLKSHSQQALRFYKERYNLNFPTATEENLMDVRSLIPSDDGTANLQPFVLSRSTRARLYSTTAGEQAQFVNVPYDFAGYVVKMTSERPRQGSRNITLPAGSIIFNANHLIDQCPPGRDYRLCEKSIITPDNPREKIVLPFHSQYYSLPGAPPSNFYFADCVVVHPRWGLGSIHGYLPTREGTKETKEARITITFPDHKY